jgi:ubiquinone/menaquinone biosynthesis C-methylase UbiE
MNQDPRAMTGPRMTKDLAAFRDQHAAVRAEFANQAESWGRDEISVDLLWAVDLFGLRSHFEVLDVAAGSGLLSRAIAPRVRGVVAVDITPEMIGEGERAAARQGIGNVRFEAGAAEDLSFPPDSFDMVVTRFSLHHFTSPDAALREMSRVCRREGRVGVVDIVSPENPALAARYNRLERLRDATHTWALSRRQLRERVEAAGLRVVEDSIRDVPVAFDDWFARTKTAPAPREEILRAIRAELAGAEATGMRPFLGGDRLLFTHAWNVVVGVTSS